MSDDQALKPLIETLERAWESGCPIAGPRARERLARAALRRWRSAGRRIRERRPPDEARIEDLAKGLRDALEADPRRVGREMEEYRHVAGLLVPVLLATAPQTK